MAYCITSEWVNTAPQVKLTVTQADSDGDFATLSWTLQYIASSAASTSVAKKYSVTLAGETVASDTYSINGKSGTHTIASGTKEIAKSTAAKNIAFSVSFGFNLTWSGVYKGTLTASGSISVAAKTSYTITYNANGGSGAPSAQTKWYGIDLTLSNTNPTKANYTFKGWATSASGGVVYAPGTSYTANAAATLYAVWELTYVKPKIYNFTVNRCDSDGTANESGKCLRLKCEWETTNSNPSARVYIYKADGNYSYKVFQLTGKSGEINAVYDFVELIADGSYTVSLNINDTGGDYEISATLNGLAFPFDAIMTEEGVGAAVGKPAEIAGLFDVALDVKFNNPVYGNVLGLNRLPAIPEGAELNDYITTGAWAIYSDDVAATITCGGVLLGTDDSVPPARAGRFEVNSSTGEGIRAEQGSFLRQRYIPYNEANPIYERDITRGEDNVWNYYDWWRSTLTPDASKKVYSKAAITLGRIENLTMAVASAYTVIPFNSTLCQTNNRLDQLYGGVVIGEDIDHVKVSANILVKCGAAGTRRFRIQKISDNTTTSHAWTEINATAGSNALYAFTPIIIPVKEGDRIQIAYYTADTTDCVVSGSSTNGQQSYLTVEEI